MRRLVVLLLVMVALAAPASARTAPLATGEHQVIINGVRLWYRVAGTGRGAPLVFLHGGPGQGSQTFARFAGPPLEAANRMIYLDQRGSGRSEKHWKKEYSLPLMVDDLEQLRRAWGVERMALVGHSFGTVLALEYAAKYPERVSHLVLAGAVVDFPAAIDVQCARLAKTDPATYAKAVAALPAGSTQRCHVFAAPRNVIDDAMYPDPAVMKMVDDTDGSDGMFNDGQISGALFKQGLLDYRFTQGCAAHHAGARHCRGRRLSGGGRAAAAVRRGAAAGAADRISGARPLHVRRGSASASRATSRRSSGSAKSRGRIMHRLFVAIRPPEAVRDLLLDTMEGVAGLRWQDDEQLHLTLRFVGEVERPLAEDLAAALATLRFEPFELADRRGRALRSSPARRPVGGGRAARAARRARRQGRAHLRRASAFRPSAAPSTRISRWRAGAAARARRSIVFLAAPCRAAQRAVPGRRRHALRKPARARRRSYHRHRAITRLIEIAPDPHLSRRVPSSPDLLPRANK